MNYDDGNLTRRLVDLKRRAQEATTRQERLKILAEATVLQSLIKSLNKK